MTWATAHEMKEDAVTQASGSAISANQAFSIRNAAPTDAAAIARLLHQLGYEIAPAVVGAKLHSFAASPIDTILLATAGDAVIGIISLHVISLLHIDGAMGRITSLVVDERHRSGGVGAGLVAAAETWFRSAGCVKLEVTSGDQRAGAHRFYERRGFRRDSQRFVKPLQAQDSPADVPS